MKKKRKEKGEEKFFTPCELARSDLKGQRRKSVAEQLGKEKKVSFLLFAVSLFSLFFSLYFLLLPIWQMGLLFSLVLSRYR